MAEETVTIQRQAPYIEERGKQLLGAVYGDPNATQEAGESAEAFQLRKFGRAGVAQNIPGMQVAGLLGKVVFLFIDHFLDAAVDNHFGAHQAGAQNAVEHAVIFCRGKRIKMEHFPK